MEVAGAGRFCCHIEGDSLAVVVDIDCIEEEGRVGEVDVDIVVDVGAKGVVVD